MQKIADTGIVITHDKTISFNVFKFKEESPFAIPTPSIDPTRACVVEIGIPSLDESNMIDAAPNSAENPLVGVSEMIL